MSPLRYPSAVRAIMHDCDAQEGKLVRLLEQMAHHRDVRDRFWKTTWFDNGYIKIHENKMYIRELAVCSMDVVKMVLAYFPNMRVCACSRFFEEHRVSSLSTQMSLLLLGCRPQHLTLVCLHADGSRSMAVCAPKPPGGVTWGPFDESLLF